MYKARQDHLVVLCFKQLAGSFPSDPFAQGFAQQQQQTKPVDASAQMLKKPPKWLRRPVGASFAVSISVLSFV